MNALGNPEHMATLFQKKTRESRLRLMSKYSEAPPGTLGKVSAQWRNHVVSKAGGSFWGIQERILSHSKVLIDGEDPKNLAGLGGM